MRYLLGAAAAALVLAAAHGQAGAFTLTNEGEHVLKVSVDKWVRRVEPGEVVRFHTYTLPVTVYFQYPNAALDCQVAALDDEVKVDEEACRINGEVAGQAQVRF